MEKGLVIAAAMTLTFVALALAAHAGGMYMNATTEYRQARISFLNAQALLQECDGNCGQATTNYTQTAGRYLAVSADLLHEHLMRLDSRLMNTTDPLRDELHNSIVTLDAAVNDTRNVTDTLSVLSTQRELENAQAMVQDNWKDVDNLTRVVSGKLTLDTMQTSIGQLLLLDKNVQHTRDSLKLMGMDTAGLDKQLTNLSMDIAVAQAQEYNAQRHYNGLANGDAAEIAAFNTSVEAAQESLDHAVETLQQVTGEIRQIFEKQFVA